MMLMSTKTGGCQYGNYPKNPYEAFFDVLKNRKEEVEKTFEVTVNIVFRAQIALNTYPFRN